MIKTEITSLQNDLIKYAVKLQNSSFRKKEGLILLDGEKSAQGVIEAGLEFEYLFLKDKNNIKNLKNAKIKNLVLVDDKILKKISTTATASSIVAIVKEKKVTKKDFLNYKKIALIEDIKDPGNLGTIIRSALAFSMDAIILFGNCVDLYSPKTIRSSASNIFKIPILQTNDIEFVKEIKKTHKIISTVVNSKKDFASYKFEDKYVIAFGSEACGLSETLLSISDEKLTIPMSNNVESLNLGVCASIVFAFAKIL